MDKINWFEILDQFQNLYALLSGVKYGKSSLKYFVTIGVKAKGLQFTQEHCQLPSQKFQKWTR